MMTVRQGEGGGASRCFGRRCRPYQGKAGSLESCDLPRRSRGSSGQERGVFLLLQLEEKRSCASSFAEYTCREAHEPSETSNLIGPSDPSFRNKKRRPKSRSATFALLGVLGVQRCMQLM